MLFIHKIVMSRVLRNMNIQEKAGNKLLLLFSDCASCKQDLSSPTRDEPVSHTVDTQSFNH